MKTPRDAYTELERHHADARDRAHRTALVISSLRGVAFLVLVAALVLQDVAEGRPEMAARAAAVLLAFGFVVLVSRHRRARAEERREETLRSLAAEGLFRLDRKWDELATALPEVEARHPDIDVDHPYARDLDVFGSASLTRLAGPVTSASGRGKLRAWLLSPSPPDAVRERQDAVRELAPALDFRQELATRGRLAPPSEEGALEALLEWAEGDPWLLAHRWTHLAAWALPLLVIVLAVLWAFRGMPPWWALPLALQFWVLARLHKRLAAGFTVVEEGAPTLQAASPQIRLMEDLRWSSPLLADMTARLATEGRPAHRAVAELVRLGDIAQSRRNLFYLMLGPVFLLDVHLGLALDRWRSRWGTEVRAWLDRVGTMEALSALATLAHDHPDWTMPGWAESPPEGESLLHARALGHPLLPPGTCVRNDVEVGPAGTFLFITGSNMSGKSTLLRAIGANAVLAGAGAPVCADALSLPEVRLWTSMRVDDSLADGVSRFMAELLRVRAVVEAARSRASGEPPVLYLLDEVLQGTNTAERRVAARAVLRHLLEEGAIGGLTSHDLTLADEPDLVARGRAFHFREHVEPGAEGARLSFDYTLRPGLATTSNALRLLESVGLGPAGGYRDDRDGAEHMDLDQGEEP